MFDSGKYNLICAIAPKETLPYWRLCVRECWGKWAVTNLKERVLLVQGEDQIKWHTLQWPTFQHRWLSFTKNVQTWWTGTLDLCHVANACIYTQTLSSAAVSPITTSPLLKCDHWYPIFMFMSRRLQFYKHLHSCDMFHFRYLSRVVRYQILSFSKSLLPCWFSLGRIVFFVGWINRIECLSVVSLFQYVETRYCRYWFNIEGY